MPDRMIDPIEIPDATSDPAAYVQALVDALGGRDALEVYESTAGRVRELCASLTDEQWDIPMADGEWSALQVVGHLVDVDIVYGFRFRLVLTEDRPTYPGYDEARWSQLARPTPTELLAALIGLRAANLALLRHTTPADRQRSGIHGEQGPERFELMVTKIAGHDLAHLNQLERTVQVALHC